MFDRPFRVFETGARGDYSACEEQAFIISQLRYVAVSRDERKHAVEDWLRKVDILRTNLGSFATWRSVVMSGRPQRRL